MDIEDFLSANKSMIIAPAGYGKTYTIADAIEAYRGNKKVLVLTHTHAGIASLLEKFKQRNLPAFKYHLDTICSFALNLTKIYHINKAEIPHEEQANEMFHFAVEHASRILQAKPIKALLSAKYDHLIVDEYQDCTLPQHLMIMVMAETLKTHLLGDSLQGIFDFNDSIVDFSDISLDDYRDNMQRLDTPWRWNNSGKSALGRDLDLIRTKLIRKEDIYLSEYSSIESVIASANDYLYAHSEYKKKLFEVLNDDNVLLIHPISETPALRVKFVQQFPQLRMIESIDDKCYYKYCDTFDRLYGKDLIVSIVEMMRKLSKTVAINKWFNERCDLVRKNKEEDLKIRGELASIVDSLIACKSYGKVAELIDAIRNLPEVKIYRKMIVNDLCNILRDAERLEITAKESIERNRNIIRRMGRRIEGKGIGTTLLTKGLEFDTVVVLNAHMFKNPKHLYVALTRCCKRLVVITETNVLHPYDK